MQAPLTHSPVTEKDRCDKLRILQDLFISEVDDSESLLLEFPAFPSVLLNLSLSSMMRPFNCDREISETCVIFFDLAVEWESDD